jgi:hypothetical protein
LSGLNIGLEKARSEKDFAKTLSVSTYFTQLDFHVDGYLVEGAREGHGQ